MKRVKFIYNPSSGEKRIVNYLDEIIMIYQSKNYILIPYRISKDEHISRAFIDIDDTYDHILIAGGDGTVNLILNAMKMLDIDLPIGILPTGTANDFANAIKTPWDIKEATKNILNSYPQNIDIGKINDRYFINVSSAGMFTDVSQKINPELKNYMGKVSYYITGIEEALHMKRFNIKVSSEEVVYKGDMYLMLVFNGKSAGNINLAYKAEIDDGYLDVIIFRGVPLPKSIPILINILKGSHLDHYNEDEILYFKTQNVVIECENDLITDMDGEKGPTFPLHIECIKDSIKILGFSK